VSAVSALPYSAGTQRWNAGPPPPIACATSLSDLRWHRYSIGSREVAVRIGPGAPQSPQEGRDVSLHLPCPRGKLLKKPANLVAQAPSLVLFARFSSPRVTRRARFHKGSKRGLLHEFFNSLRRR